MNDKNKHIIIRSCPKAIHGKYISILLVILTVSSCEEVYNPHLKVADNYIVIEAKIYANNQQNDIHLCKSKNLDDTGDYEKIIGATVTLTDDNGAVINAQESDTPGTYRVNYLLDQNRSYYLSVKTGGEEYISDYQAVPKVPSIDTVYGAYEDNVYTIGVSDSPENVSTTRGIRLFADISNNGNLSYYRFSGKKVFQFSEVPVSYIPTVIYSWKTYYPTGLFNIAGPSDYSTEKNIKKHKLDFFTENFYEIIEYPLHFAGWIYIIDQDGLNEDTYNYYQELNKQLGAEGRIFDPLYLQVEGNIRCSTNPDIVTFGNFEISSHREYRYFLIYLGGGQSFTLKRIPYFYNIPEQGSVAVPPADYPPDFWETTNKNYPDG